MSREKNGGESEKFHFLLNFFVEKSQITVLTFFGWDLNCFCEWTRVALDKYPIY